MEAKLYQQETGIRIYVSSGRFDMQFCVKRLSEMMSKPRRLGDLRLATLVRYLVGTRKVSLRFDYRRTATSCEFPWTPTRLAVKNGTPLMEGFTSTEPWVLEKQNSTDLQTKHMYEEMGRTINIDVETDSTAAIGMCSRTGVWKTRHIQVRWLWIQTIRDKVVRLKREKGIENETDIGTKELDGPTH